MNAPPLLLWVAALTAAALTLSCHEDLRVSVPAPAQAMVVNGTSTPEVVSLSAAQRRAVGAVLTWYYGGWYMTCTGTLIAPRVVLTAAHCFEDLDTGDFTPAEDIAFVVGNDIDAPVEEITVAERYVHPGYDPWTLSATHDVAILILAEETARADPLAINCDPLVSLGLVGEWVQNVGFGITDTDGGGSGRKWWVAQQVTALSSHDLTVDGYGEAGVCSGDSGGPSLWSMPDGVVRVIGSLSWGDSACGRADHFARVDDNCDFIAPLIERAGTALPWLDAGCDVEGVFFDAVSIADAIDFFATMTCAECDALFDSRTCEDAINDADACTIGGTCTGCDDDDSRADGLDCAELAGYAYFGANAAERFLDYLQSG